MPTSRNRKASSTRGKKASPKAAAEPRTARSVTAKPATATRTVKKAGRRATQKTAKTAARTGTARTAKRADARNGTTRTTPAASPKASGTRPASVKSAARAVAAARAGAAKRRAPSYIPRSRYNDDWMLGGPVELPRQPAPAAHAPTRKPPKPRAPKPKAISHEQAVANLKALLESRKRKDRSGSTGASAAGNA